MKNLLQTVLNLYLPSIYIHKINTFAASGVNFIKNGYCPEECEKTKEFLHEREDYGHLLNPKTTDKRFSPGALDHDGHEKVR